MTMRPNMGRPMQGRPMGPQRPGQPGQPQQAQPQQPPANPEEIAALLKEATEAFNRKEFPLAELRTLELVQKAPGHVEGLTLLYKLKRQSNKTDEALNILRRLGKRDPNLLWVQLDLAQLLFFKGDRGECEIYGRNAIRLAPRNPTAHQIMGMILTETNRTLAGEWHYRRALELSGPQSRLCANLANNLKNQGKMDESEYYYREAVRLEPKNYGAIMGWARMEEARRNFDRSWELIEEAGKLVKEPPPDMRLARAVLYGRSKDYDKALTELTLEKKEVDAAAGKDDRARNAAGLNSMHLLERGRLLDKMGRFDEAWADYVEGKRLVREVQGRRYGEKAASELSRRLKTFFTRQRLSLLPRATVNKAMPQPLFIVGFPRSGTTMVEQTLTAHPNMCAGDELPFINDITRVLPRMLNSPLQYPEALADLWMGDNQLALDNLRDFYLKRTEQLGILRDGVHYFTDKMPLNETHLGLISLLFPESPIIHLIRHPLDTFTSVWSNYLTHGFNCAFDLTTIAKHQMLIADLVEHYRANLDMKYMAVRYEDIVADQEPHVRKLLDFVGEPFDPRCLQFHENVRYARTASYAQVTEKLYDSSKYRYRNYVKHMVPVIEILDPLIKKLGYEVEM